MACDAVAPHLSQYVLGVVGPSQRHVAACQSRLGHACDVGLRAVEPQDIVVGAGRFDEFATAELCLGHEEPCAVEVWVELLASQVGFLLCRLALVGIGGRALLDAVQLDGLLALGDGRLVVSLAQFGGLLVRADVHGQHLGVVFHVSLKLCLAPFLIGHLAVVECVEACRGGMEESGGRGVFLGRAGCKCKHYKQIHAQADASAAPASVSCVCMHSHPSCPLRACRSPCLALCMVVADGCRVRCNAPII